MTTMPTGPRQDAYGERPHWKPARPRIRPFAVLLSWLLSALALLIAAEILPNASVNNFGGALVAVLAIAILNAILPPIVAAFRLPFMLLVGFGLVLVLDALMLLAADRITGGDLHV
jgi:putative membrane protein